MSSVPEVTELKARLRPRLLAQLNDRYAMLDGHRLRRGIAAAVEWLRTNKEAVNSLNVFPVPDGDTGTNMLLTMQAAWDEIEAHADPSASNVVHGIAQGALMGARGNSGVILSQLWRGFARSVDGKASLTVADVCSALQEARATAYKGVVRPVEGTILTVSKDVSQAAGRANSDGARSIVDLLEVLVEAAKESVQRTPSLLPVLKEAGVVDAGGKGLEIILEGMLRGAYRLPLDQPTHRIEHLDSIAFDAAEEAVEPGQDWEVIVDFRPEEPLNLDSFYERLEALGTSIQVGEGDGHYRMHIHVMDERQYEPIEYVRTLGTVTTVHIENLMDQIERGEESAAQELQLDRAKPGQVAAVAVAPGPGIARVFANLGAASIIEGGQTMNPSTQEILRSFENLPTDEIIILPNNKNILLAARQAAELTVKDVWVIPSVTVPQGIAAILKLDPAADASANLRLMERAITEITTGELTVATRSVELDGVTVSKGQVIGLLDGELRVAGDEIEICLRDLLSQALHENAELITLYHGADQSAASANRIADQVREEFPTVDVELLEGGQPHYDFIISIE